MGHKDSLHSTIVVGGLERRYMVLPPPIRTSTRTTILSMLSLIRVNFTNLACYLA